MSVFTALLANSFQTLRRESAVFKSDAGYPLAESAVVIVSQIRALGRQR